MESVRITGLVFVAIAIASVACAAQEQSTVSVTTWHNDIWRTGQNNMETQLTTALVSSTKTFGRQCSAPVDGKIYGQPLVVAGVQFMGGSPQTVAYVVTQNDSVYAFDTQCHQLLKMPLLTNGEESALRADIGTGCGTITPQIGILGTPVIDTGSGTLYVIAESECPANTQCNQTNAPIFFHRIHALNITSLQEQANSPVQVCSSGCGGVSATVFSKGHIQRPGLLWLSATQANRPNNMVYAAFSMIDGDQTHPPGWIFGFNSQKLNDTSQQISFQTTNNIQVPGGGIWQAGAGLAAGKDDNGQYYIYVSTADGAFDLENSGTNGGDSFLKVTTSLQLASGTPYFTPSDECYRSSGIDEAHLVDLDFGSGGTILIPDGTIPSYPHIAIKADKENYLWVMQRTLPGGFNAGSCQPTSPPVSCSGQTINACAPTGWANQNLAAFPFIPSGTTGFGQTRATPVYWGGNQSIYIAGTYTAIYRYPFSNCSPNPPIICTLGSYSNNGRGPPPPQLQMGISTNPSISANHQGTTYSNGIVWAIKNPSDPPTPTGPAILYAFDATTLNELYDSSKCLSMDAPGLATKFSTPTISNGQVFIGTQTDFDIYGLLSPQRQTCN